MAFVAKRFGLSKVRKVSYWLAPEGAKTMARYGERSASIKDRVVVSDGSRVDVLRRCLARRPRSMPALIAAASPVAVAAGAGRRSPSCRFFPNPALNRTCAKSRAGRLALR